MSTILISYADRSFFKSQKMLNKSAAKHGVDKTISFNDIWLRKQKDFFEANKKILTQKRGAGYWLWKPFIILHTLQNINEDDTLLYIDAGTLVINNVKPLVDIVNKNGIALFSNDMHLNRTWTKRDCFYYMNCDEKKYHDGYQVSTYMGLKKNKSNLSLIKEWLNYSMDERIISDNENVCGLSNFEDFKDHRHDQSVLSILAIKYNIEIFRDPSQWGNSYKLNEYKKPSEFSHATHSSIVFGNSPYPTILHSHRDKMPLNFIDKADYLFKKIYANLS